MFHIVPIDSPKQKSHICDAILHALPDWFGIEPSIVEYVQHTQTIPFWAALDGSQPVGFVALKEHNPYTAEVCVMGVLAAYHRQGIGRALIQVCEAYCAEHQVEYLTVKTLDASRESRSYAQTRQFYLSMGFRPLGVFPLYWGEPNPCLFMAKRLKNLSPPAYFSASSRVYRLKGPFSHQTKGESAWYQTTNSCATRKRSYPGYTA